MLLLRIGEEGPLKTCAKGGSMFWTTTSRYVKNSQVWISQLKVPQIDPDRAVAAGASWGGYAIK